MAAPSRTAQVRARERARAQLAERRAAQRAREEANETDLVAFFAAAEEVTAAEAVRVKAVAAAQHAYDQAVAAATSTQQDTVRALRTRGEPVTDIAALTGWSTAEVRKATKSGTPSETQGETAPVSAGSESAGAAVA